MYSERPLCWQWHLPMLIFSFAEFHRVCGNGHSNARITFISVEKCPFKITLPWHTKVVRLHKGHKWVTLLTLQFEATQNNSHCWTITTRFLETKSLEEWTFQGRQCSRDTCFGSYPSFSIEKKCMWLSMQCLKTVRLVSWKSCSYFFILPTLLN